MAAYCLTVTCRSTIGIVAAISSYLADCGCNIVDSSQFDDEETGRFFMRVSFVAPEGRTPGSLCEGFSVAAERFGMTFGFHDESEKMKVVILVSRFGHCLNDLLYRWRIGALPVEIVAVVSNHEDYRGLVEGHNIPFHHVEAASGDKAEAEARLLEIIETASADLIILARYMQVLSESLCRTLEGRVINIHHSFLPAFKGANPYRQAFKRGVKLIGATAHYVTADLDEGPIIEQGTARITHAQNPKDYVSIGRDVEAQVLAKAVHAHAGRRVFPNGAKTVVFPASPGSYSSERMG